MKTLPEVIESLGGLHDARLLRVSWDATKVLLVIDIDDAHANDEDEAHSPAPGCIRFGDVIRLDLDVALVVEGLAIYECSIAASGDRYRTEVSLSPGGRIEIESSSVPTISF